MSFLNLCFTFYISFENVYVIIFKYHFCPSIFFLTFPANTICPLRIFYFYYFHYALSLHIYISWIYSKLFSNILIIFSVVFNIIQSIHLAFNFIKINLILFFNSGIFILFYSVFTYCLKFTPYNLCSRQY